MVLQFNGSMKHLQNIVWVLKRNKIIVNIKSQFVMANYEIVEFSAIMQCLINK